MIRRWSLLVSGLVLAAACLVPVSLRSAPADPITGAWAGQLAPADMSRPIDVTMALRLDSHNLVSGTVSGLPNPADVKTGSFDPKSGALKMQLGKIGDPKVLLTLEGVVKESKATGKLGGDGTGSFTLTRHP